MGVKINFRIIRKKHTADPGIGFFKKSISKPFVRAMATPPAWESITYILISKYSQFKSY